MIPQIVHVINSCETLEQIYCEQHDEDFGELEVFTVGGVYTIRLKNAKMNHEGWKSKFKGYKDHKYIWKSQ